MVSTPSVVHLRVELFAKQSNNNTGAASCFRGLDGSECCADQCGSGEKICLESDEELPVYLSFSNSSAFASDLAQLRVDLRER